MKLELLEVAEAAKSILYGPGKDDFFQYSMKHSQWHRKMSDQHKLMWIFYILVLSVVLASLELETELLSSLTSVFKSEDETSAKKYVIVMDAGSTGYSTSIEKEFKIKSKPGLSSYTHEPKKIANLVSGLLEIAKAYIPKQKWAESPLSLIATAGLRTISDEDANIILRTVRKVFKNSPFLFHNDSVYLLTGKQEGKLENASDTAALLDLGGESIQIAFAEDNLDAHKLKINELQKLQMKSIILYTRSYLGIGLMDARLSLAKVTTEPILQIDVVEYNGRVTFASPCIHPDAEEFWDYGFKKKFVKYQSDKEYGFENCYPMAVKYLGNIIDKPLELQKRELYALSSYAERAFELGLIGIDGGKSTIGEFVETCKYFCSNLMPATTFTCLDCSYISALWQHGLGLNAEKEIKFTKNIGGIHVEWTLGAALKVLENK